MKNNSYKILIVFFVALVTMTFFFAFTKIHSEPKTAFVNIGKLYSDFQMKKELENKITNVQQARKTIMDSLELSLKVIAKQLDAIGKTNEEMSNRFIGLREEYLTKQKQFSEDNTAMTQQYNEQIMKQLKIDKVHDDVQVIQLQKIEKCYIENYSIFKNETDKNDDVRRPEENGFNLNLQ